jgi:hypothetical protein
MRKNSEAQFLNRSALDRLRARLGFGRLQVTGQRTNIRHRGDSVRCTQWLRLLREHEPYRLCRP